jgi:hypothetical protein
MIKHCSESLGQKRHLGVFSLLVFLSLQGECLSVGAKAGSQASELSEVSIPRTTVWTGIDGNPLPFKTHEEIKEFLLEAKVISKHGVDTGVTNPWRLVLEKDGVRANAVFRYVDIFKDNWVDPKKGPRLRWRDYCVYEIAAYELSQLIGLDVVPPTVQRRIEKKDGSLQLWIEGALMEKERLEKGIQPPNMLRFVLQVQVMKIFDDLIYNDDRNLGNMLYDKDWKLWLIDHTRAFRLFNELPESSQLQRCERGLWENLQKLDEAVVRERMKGILNGMEIKGLLQRIDLMVEHYSARIAEKGEAHILFTIP